MHTLTHAHVHAHVYTLKKKWFPKHDGCSGKQEEDVRVQWQRIRWETAFWDGLSEEVASNSSAGGQIASISVPCRWTSSTGDDRLKCWTSETQPAKRGTSLITVAWSSLPQGCQPLIISCLSLDRASKWPSTSDCIPSSHPSSENWAIIQFSSSWPHWTLLA